MLFLWKKKYFARDYRSINVINRRELNILQSVLVKKKTSKELRERIEIFRRHQERKILSNREHR